MPVLKPSNKMFLNTIDIYTTCLSAKLSQHHLNSYIVKKKVESMSYYFKLLLALQRLYFISNVIKLTAALEDLISNRYSCSYQTLLLLIERKNRRLKRF